MLQLHKKLSLMMHENASHFAENTNIQISNISYALNLFLSMRHDKNYIIFVISQISQKNKSNEQIISIFSIISDDCR